MSYTNPSSPMDYTNNDFRAIFPELLEVVKTLSSKWDPSISNESDPGVILLKLNAIIGDKNNYNIDKNILEAFPQTLTQDVSARMIYKQLGYNMPWYESAEVDVTFKYTGDLADVSTSVGGWKLTIPKYTTMVTNETGDIVYTLLDDVEITRNELTVTARAIQGIWTQVKVAGSTDLTYSNLDDNNRIYFDDYAVPQNGIFVTSYDGGLASIWERVDNIASINTYEGQYYYEFGVDPQSGATYIEFPQNAADLISEKFTVSYVLTQGSEGVVSARDLSKFYSDVTAKVYNDGEVTEEALDSETVVITNASGSVGGNDPETTSSAYRSFQKVVGTFDTLITLRDYINAVYNSGIVSNAQVSDRYHDIQSSAVVMSDNNGSGDPETIADGSMNAYDLKLTLVGSNATIRSVADYENSFSLEVGLDKQKYVESYLSDSKAVGHDYSDFLRELPIVFQNRYAIQIRFIPKYKLSAIELSSVKTNMVDSLTALLNARRVDFGGEPNYDEIYATVEAADTRIQTLIINDFRYTTYAIYLDNNGVFKTIPIAGFDNDSSVILGTPSTTQVPKTQGTYYLVDAADSYKCYIFNSDTDTGWQEYSTLIQEFRKRVTLKSILAGLTPFCLKDSEFVRNINMENQEEVTNVDKIATNLQITLPQSTSYTMRANETVQIFSPELAASKNFSTSIKMCFVANGEYPLLHADTPYQLKAEERILFLVQETDGDEAPYTVYAYDGTNKIDSPIVRTTFDLDTSKIPAVIALDPDANPPTCDLSGLKNRSKVAYGTAEWRAIRDYMYQNYDLSGSRSVDMLKIAQVEQEPNTFFYFITNRQSDGKYVITLPTEGLMKDSYVLDSNEYFFVVDKTRTATETLGPGTLIRFKGFAGNSNIVEVEALDPFTISEEGLQSFVDALVPVSQYADGLLLRQQKITVAAVGDTLTNETDTTISLGQEYVSIEQLNVVIGGTSTVLHQPEYNTDGDETLSLYGRAILNVSASPYTAQVVSDFSETDQEDPQATATQSITVDGQEYTNVSFLTAYPTTVAGGSDVSIAYMDLITGDAIKQSILFYTPSEDYFTQTRTLSAGDEIELPVTEVAGTFYIIPVTSEKHVAPQVITSNNPDVLARVISNTDTGVSFVITTGTCILKMPSNASVTSDTWTFRDFYRYVYNTNLIYDGVEQLLDGAVDNTGSFMDSGFHRFKWDYQPADAERILDPLMPVEFFNNQHVCNKFTLPVAQLGFRNRDIKDSLIQEINNR